MATYIYNFNLFPILSTLLLGRLQLFNLKYWHWLHFFYCILSFVSKLKVFTFQKKMFILHIRDAPRVKNPGGPVVMRRAAAARRRLLICQNLGGPRPPRPPRLLHACYFVCTSFKKIITLLLLPFWTSIKGDKELNDLALQIWEMVI